MEYLLIKIRWKVKDSKMMMKELLLCVKIVYLLKDGLFDLKWDKLDYVRNGFYVLLIDCLYRF